MSIEKQNQVGGSFEKRAILLIFFHKFSGKVIYINIKTNVHMYKAETAETV